MPATTIEPREFASGRITLEPHHAWLWNDAVQGPPDTAVHPSTACMLVLSGAGVTVSEIMTYLQTEPSQVLFGEIGFSFHQPLRVHQAFSVLTAIESIERKQGKRMPVFDRVTLNYRLCDEASREPIVDVKQVWVVDRSTKP